MVMSQREKSLNRKIKQLGLSTKIASSYGVREMTVSEKADIIKKTMNWKRAFKKEGKRLGPKTVLFRGRKYTNSGTLL